MTSHPAYSSTQTELRFVYDAEHRRVQKIISENEIPVDVTAFLYDDFKVIATLDSSGNPKQTFHWTHEGPGGLLTLTDHRTSPRQTHVAGYDGRGNLTTLLNAADASLSAAYEYSPFGEVIRATGAYAPQNPFGFSTTWTDRTTHLNYYGYRFYHPAEGRFLNQDPIEEQGGNNLYAAFSGDPVNRRDFRGLSDMDGRDMTKWLLYCRDGRELPFDRYGSYGFDKYDWRRRFLVGGDSGDNGDVVELPGMTIKGYRWAYSGGSWSPFNMTALYGRDGYFTGRFASGGLGSFTLSTSGELTFLLGAFEVEGGGGDNQIDFQSSGHQAQGREEFDQLICDRERHAYKLHQEHLHEQRLNGFFQLSSRNAAVFSSAFDRAIQNQIDSVKIGSVIVGGVAAGVYAAHASPVWAPAVGHFGLGVSKSAGRLARNGFPGLGDWHGMQKILGPVFGANTRGMSLVYRPYQFGLRQVAWVQQRLIAVPTTSGILSYFGGYAEGFSSAIGVSPGFVPFGPVEPPNRANPLSIFWYLFQEGSNHGSGTGEFLFGPGE